MILSFLVAVNRALFFVTAPPGVVLQSFKDFPYLTRPDSVFGRIAAPANPLVMLLQLSCKDVSTVPRAIRPRIAFVREFRWRGSW
jgi:hypothetical protein